MAGYARQIATADRLIRKYGELVTFHRLSDWTGDKPWKPSDDPTETDFEDVPIVYYTETGLGRELLAYFQGADVPAGQTLAMIPGNVAFNPQLKDTIDSPTMGLLKVLSNNPISPSGIPIVHMLRLEQ